MAAKSKSRRPHSQKPVRSNDIEENIRKRAYHLYEQRGRGDEFASDDWLQQQKAHAVRGSRC
jgi:Protein of unknown function (DUF2934)